MEFFPIFTQLKHRAVLLIGAGEVAQRKAESLLKANARILLIAQQLNEQFTLWVQEEKIQYIALEFDAVYIDQVFLVIAATNNTQLNQYIFESSEAKNKLCNVVDTPKHCSFITPAIIDRSPLQVAISSGAHSPVLARIWKQKIETLIPLHTGRLAIIVGKWRQRIKAKISNTQERKDFWEKLFQSSFNHLVATQKEQAAENFLESQLKQWQKKIGEVVLVGAGPGDPGLLTLHAFQALQSADIVLHDALISTEILELIRKDALKINVGKRAKKHTVPQEKINQLLIQYAQQGMNVIRLKGGDAFIFGRGGEEAQILAQSQIPFRVIPGITAGLGATAYAGIPLTHRDYAQSVVFLTGHSKTGLNNIHWPALVQNNQTLVIYMGTLYAKKISEHLIDHGKNKCTPVALISQGASHQQYVITGCLHDLAKLAEQVQPPTLIIIGDVVKLHREINWFKSSQQIKKVA